MMLMAVPLAQPVRADLVHRLTTSTQLAVDSAYTSGTRLGSTYTVSGSNIKVDTSNSGHFGTMTAATATAAAAQDLGTYDVNTAGSAFSFSESWTQGDAVNTIGAGVDVSADGLVVDMPAFGITTTHAGGVKGSLAGTILSSGVLTLVAGGSNTSAVGQFVSEITVK